MNISKEQADAVRRLLESDGAGKPFCGDNANAAFRLVIRLGLCVVESGVTADLLRLHIQESPFTVNAVDEMHSALARELEASR